MEHAMNKIDYKQRGRDARLADERRAPPKVTSVNHPRHMESKHAAEEWLKGYDE